MSLLDRLKLLEYLAAVHPLSLFVKMYKAKSGIGL